MLGVILAGGSGTRFWPKSREVFPKQFLRISGSKTMIQHTVERILPIIPIKDIFVVANELHTIETCRQLSDYGFSPSNLLAEPAGKNTAPALGFAASILEKMFKRNEVVAALPADHIVNDPAAFQRVLLNAESAAKKGLLVTLGVQPNRPETGYGYIKKGNPLDGLTDSFQVERFIEKPDAATAQRFLEDGRYFWNCGVFVWQIKTLLTEIQDLMPGLAANLDSISSNTEINRGKYAYQKLNTHGRKTYESLPSISIDYGIMEISRNVAMVPAPIHWNDIGSWTAIEEVEQKDAAGNVIGDNVVSIDCSGSIIRGDNRLIAAIGAKDIIVVDTPDALLVCDKNRAQDIKKVVDEINSRQRPEARIPARVPKPWGFYTVLEKHAQYVVKKIEVLPGEKLSLQMHKHKDKDWFVVVGEAEIRKDDDTFRLNTGSTFIPRGTEHRLGNTGDSPLIVIEIEIGDHVDENDVVRFDDLYGRD